MKTSEVVYEIDCNNCLKGYTGETRRKLKKKEHKGREKKIKKK